MIASGAPQTPLQQWDFVPIPLRSAAGLGEACGHHFMIFFPEVGVPWLYLDAESAPLVPESAGEAAPLASPSPFYFSLQLKPHRRGLLRAQPKK